jgi:hypothetical protein
VEPDGVAGVRTDDAEQPVSQVGLGDLPLWVRPAGLGASGRIDSRRNSMRSSGDAFCSEYWAPDRPFRPSTSENAWVTLTLSVVLGLTVRGVAAVRKLPAGA